MRSAIGLIALGLTACTFPETRMVPVADYGSGHTTVSAAPANTAGPEYVRTTSPDGATLFVCEDGGTMRGSKVPPHVTPAC